MSVDHTLGAVAPTRTHAVVCLSCKYVTRPMTPEYAEEMARRMRRSPSILHDPYVLPVAWADHYERIFDDELWAGAFDNDNDNEEEL